MKKLFSIFIVFMLVIIVSGCSLFKEGSKSTSVTYLAFVELTQTSSLKDMFNADDKILDIEYSDNLIQKMQLDTGVATNPQLTKIKYYDQLIKDGNIYEEINYASSLIFVNYFSNLNLSNSASRDFCAAIYDELIDYKNAVQNLKDATERLETVAAQPTFIVLTDKSLSIGSCKELENFKDAYNNQITASINLSNKYVSFLNTYIFNISQMPALMLAMTEQLKIASVVFETILAFNETEDKIIDYTYTQTASSGTQVTTVTKTVGTNFYSGLIQSLVTTNTNLKTIIANYKVQVVEDSALITALNTSYDSFAIKISQFDLLRGLYLTSVNSVNTSDLTLSSYLETPITDALTEARLIYVLQYLENDYEQYNNLYNDLITKLIAASGGIV